MTGTCKRVLKMEVGRWEVVEDEMAGGEIGKDVTC